jgi:imidazolonepropionase-like amidohydrolase
MKFLRVAAFAGSAAFVIACQPTPPVTTSSHVVNLSMAGLTLGEERVETTIEGRRETSVMHTTFSRAPGVKLTGRLVIDRGRPVSLHVDGDSPAFLPSSVNVTVTGDRTDTFPVRSPLPVHILAAIARQAVVTSTRTFRALPEGAITVGPCGAGSLPYSDATCHELSGVTWGAAHVFLDQRQKLAAAVVPTPWGLLLATTPDRDDSHPALLAHFATARATRLAEAAPPITSAHRQPLVFRNVRVIDPASAQVANATVVLNGDRISAVGDDAATPEPARVIDGSGLSLLPGLRDMHGHLKQPEWGPAYLAAGVTTAYDLGNEEPFILALREMSTTGPYPRLVLAAFIDAHTDEPYAAVQANTPEQARFIVRRFKKAGFDEVKVWQHVSRDVVQQIVKEAHSLGMRVTGHVPDGMTAFDAIDAGLDRINHSGGLVDASNGNLTSADGRRLIARLLEGKVVVDPTLVVMEYGTRSTATPLSDLEPGFAKAPRPVQRAWSAFGQPPDRANDAPLRRAMELVRGLHAAGVPIVAGTDQGVPGHTLHRELELYVRAGLTPMQALATATAGRIHTGEPADLVLVSGSPDVSISDIRKVRYVVKSGRLYEPAPLWRAVGFQP